MKRTLLLAGAAWLAATHAWASDQVLRGPAPDWLIPTPVYRSNTPDDPTQAVRVELIESQIHKGQDTNSIYVRMRYKAVSPVGLQQASQFSVNWNPAFGSATVHAVEVIRNGERINVLDRADFTVLRREEALEQSRQINGILTGVLMIPDLRVGDTVELSQTITASMPLLGSPLEGMGPLLSPMASDQMHTALLWPKTHNMQHRAGSEVPAPTLMTVGDYKVAQFNLTDVKATTFPSDLVSSDLIKHSFQYSDVPDFNAVSTRIMPLFDAASTLPDDAELAAHIARIKAEHSTPQARALAALRLVQDEVRYLAIAIGDAGWQPADAKDVWKDRAGDCKGKTVLLIAILRELGIEASAALTSSQLTALDQYLPMYSLFDHVIVKARIDGRDVYMDGTRTGDRSLIPDQPLEFSHVLPLVPNARLVALPQSLPPRPLNQTLLEIDMSAGLYSPARITASRAYRGFEAIAYQGGIALFPNEVAAYSKQLWEDLLEDLGPIQDQQSRWEYLPDTHEVVFTTTGTATLDWSGSTANIPLAHVSWAAPTLRTEGPFIEDAVAIKYPAYSSFRTTLVMPEGANALDINVEPYDVEASGVRYFRTVEREGNRLTTDRQRMALRRAATAAEERAAKALLDSFKDKKATMRPSRSYSMSSTDQSALTTVSTHGAEAALRRGYTVFEAGDYQAAIAQFTAAIEGFSTPNANALANRALAYIALENYDNARADIAAADAITQTEVITFHAKGKLAEVEKDDLESVLAYTSAIQIWPENTHALYRRSAAYERMGQNARAVADIERVISLNPTEASAVFDLASLQVRLGNISAAHDSVKRAAELSNQQQRVFNLFVAVLQRDLEDIRLVDPAKTEAILTSALEIETDVPAFLLERAFAREAQGNARGANADKARFKQLTTIDLGNPASLCTLDRAPRLYEYSRYAVIKLCDQAIAEGKETAEVQISRGNALYLQSKLPEALVAYGRAYELEPANAYVLYGYGTLLVQNGEGERGEKMIADSRAANSNSHGNFPVRIMQ